MLALSVQLLGWIAFATTVGFGISSIVLLLLDDPGNGGFVDRGHRARLWARLRAAEAAEVVQLGADVAACGLAVDVPDQPRPVAA